MGPQIKKVSLKLRFGTSHTQVVVAMRMEDQNSYLFHPAVIASDWIAFFILFGAAAIIGAKLMNFPGPSKQPEDSWRF